MAAKQQSEFNFEEALQELERLVSSMEEGELSLEDSMKAFEKGIKLTRECQTALQKAAPFPPFEIPDLEKLLKTYKKN